ncbi:uncharacterized protein LOC114934248 isoform X1 [Nylanderia fulva]|uniref:uncharacterized protein LOC114934248 isoform X1 n=1 Tax=Nylanderia fulva TaxID=613905 RepID=UPI0010FB687F|nr:uncharacterized protein LOC114934248 isoform X1 [Nylanderia fulva]XP_029162744.1 uncharacterized protein LOC114934248 isoform X1 [Nylanderia fulva]
MSEIDHTFWDNIFESQQYEDIDVVTLKKLQEKIKAMEKDVSVMQQDFDYICGKIFGTPITRKKPEEGISVQNNIGSTTSREQLDREQVTDSTPSEIDNEKNELLNKYLQFVEIMYQDEIIRIKNQIVNYWQRHHRKEFKDQIPIQREYFTNIISLINNLLHLEKEVLKFKIERAEMRTKMKTGEIDHEKCKLLMDNKYLQFVKMTRENEINRIFVQLHTYRNNMPNKDVHLIKYEDFTAQKIKEIKNILYQSGQVMEFNLQIEREATNMETNNVGTSNVPSNADNLKNKLLKNNQYLWYIVKAHQSEINRLYANLERHCTNYCDMLIDYKYDLNLKLADIGEIDDSELERFCNDDNVKVIDNEYHLASNMCAGIDDVEKTNNVPSNIDEKGLTRHNTRIRSFAAECKSSFNDIYNELEMYCSKYDMPNENVTIDMHTELYDRTKTTDEENELKKENEYLAFVAMMHLEKMREILFSSKCFAIDSVIQLKKLLRLTISCSSKCM